jgi:hypothetical protein
MLAAVHIKLNSFRTDFNPLVKNSLNPRLYFIYLLDNSKDKKLFFLYCLLFVGINALNNPINRIN